MPIIGPPKPLTPTPEENKGSDGPGDGDIARIHDADTEAPTKSPALPTTTEDATASPLLPVKSESPAAATLTASDSPPLDADQTPGQGHDSQVLNDTLNVINEHITHLQGSPSNGGLHVPPAANDSGSEYSMPVDQRLSYIQGEETDEEEEREHTRPEVESWNSDQVAEYLFTAGVEKQHCEVFRDQEITGDVLLGMDQGSLFIKAFDLGSVGRRLKTWHKIKLLQDEVNTPDLARRTTQTGASDLGSEDAKLMRSRTSTTATSLSNRVSSQRASTAQTAKASPHTRKSPITPSSSHDSPPLPGGHVKRPSAASVRELHHSRRHSSTDYRAPISPLSGGLPASTPPALSPNGTRLESSPSHRKQSSFDRNWTLGNALGGQIPTTRPLSSVGLQDALAGPETGLQDSAVDLDRGYFSGTETDGRRRNLLRKRDGATHSRTSSYADEQRVRSATALSRLSRFGSVDSIRDPPISPAAQKYFSIQQTPHRRTASTNTAESARPIPPAKDSPVPIVTRIDTGLNPTRSPVSPVTAGRQGFAPDWLTAVVNKPMGKSRPGMRAISDKLSSTRSKDVPPSDSALESPARTTSSTASGERSLEVDSPIAGKSFNTTQTSKGNKRKGKKDTSAYTRGLQMISPLEAKRGADYYGWMKKKSSNLMTTWKPRFFVLKGRRLAYFYSEDDDQEKGLIDISFHRVLPAGNERLTGLHATLTGAVGGGPSLSSESNGAAEKSHEPVFIFKLVPPRAGLSRAVNFTKPTVHYFAVPNLEQGRLWMAALMKATIDRDDTQPISTTYQQKTISLNKAKQMRHRPPALMNLEEMTEDDQSDIAKPVNGLGILGEADSGVSGMGKLGGVKPESAGLPSEHMLDSASSSLPRQST